jgi:excinuclease ABC subunit A
VGTSTEIYDYLKLLYARIGKTFSPVSGNAVTRQRVTDVVDYMNGFDEGTLMTIAAPLRPKNGRTVMQEAELLMQQGFSRLETNNEIKRIDELLKLGDVNLCNENCNIIIDRISLKTTKTPKAGWPIQFKLLFMKGMAIV